MPTTFRRAEPAAAGVTASRSEREERSDPANSGGWYLGRCDGSSGRVGQCRETVTVTSASGPPSSTSTSQSSRRDDASQS